MRFTHLQHSCILVEHEGTQILFDPGTFSAGFEELTGLDAILVTHQHPDHADPARLPGLVAANPDALRYADPQTAAQLNERGDAGTWSILGPGGDGPDRFGHRTRHRWQARRHPSGTARGGQHLVHPRHR